MLHRLDDELVVVRQVEYRAGSTRIGQFPQRGRAHGHLINGLALIIFVSLVYSTNHKIIWLDAKKIPKVAKSDGRIDLVSKLAVVVGRCKARSLWRKGNALDLPEIHHKQIALGLRGQAADLERQLENRFYFWIEIDRYISSKYNLNILIILTVC